MKPDAFDYQRAFDALAAAGVDSPSMDELDACATISMHVRRVRFSCAWLLDEYAKHLTRNRGRQLALFAPKER